MNDLVRNVDVLDSTIRELEKNNSKLENGHFIFAHDKNHMMIDKFKSIKMTIIEESQKSSSKNPNILEDINFLDKIIRELEKINSKIENGHIPFAWRDNRRVLAEIKSAKEKFLEKSVEKNEK